MDSSSYPNDFHEHVQSLWQQALLQPRGFCYIVHPAPSKRQEKVTGFLTTLQEFLKMMYESLDPNLADGIESICQKDWTTAQTILTRRLDETRHLGCRRTTLFLLAFVARAAGHAGIAEKLLEEAARTPADLAEPRLLSETELTLQNEWLAFNRWTPQEPSSPTESVAKDIDWAALLDATLEGRASEFERRWSGHVVGDSPHRHILWNLLALAYLENGDLRTYDEMFAERPTSPPSYMVPSELQNLLARAHLNRVADELNAGRWLTSTVFVSAECTASVSPHRRENHQWKDAMESAFSLLSVGRSVEAAREFSLLMNQSLSATHRIFTLNALALALFQSGEYADAEVALRDFRVQEQDFDSAEDPDLADMFRVWLGSVEATPEPNSPFHNPFGKAVLPDALTTSGPEHAQQQFDEALSTVIHALKVQDLPGAQRILRGMFSQNSTVSVTERFVVALFFAGTALLDGDHMNAQEGIEDASGILAGGNLDENVLVQIKELLNSVGAINLSGKFEMPSLHTLDPWRDFPLDFPQVGPMSLSE